MRRIHYELSARGGVLSLGQTTRIMGIVNCTPDSFSGDGRSPDAALRHARRLIAAGADLIDIGGESTRPGSSAVSLNEEIRRVIPVVDALARKARIPISVDTTKLEVAKRALDAGASIVNDIKGANVGTRFLRMVRDYEAAIVLMHMRGTPATMQRYARYNDVVREVIEELQISVEKCLAVGIKKDRIIVDPGIGFSKTAQQNLVLIQNLSQLKILHCPVLLGTSRKSFIGQILEQEVGDRLMGTAASVSVGIMQGAHIVRVHDVKRIKETVKVTDAILNAQA